ncbi:transcription factor HES-7-like [Astyanax mexicanus]|uniref:Transcription factor HES-7-like n=1 Tax=Astyanax mexicanus TaxID=7994 RepID=A0A8B9RA82_ASTMX|nr:transcription factor HES-7-like [Astyanax mexicanus]
MGTPKMANRRASKRILKPVIEKKRRDRINQRLDELRTLLLDNTLDSRLQNPKLEKAEILELTVDYIRKRSSIGTESKDSNKDSLDVVAPLPTSRKPRLPCISIHDPTSLQNNSSLYTAGFQDCISRLTGFIDCVEPSQRENFVQGLRHHLDSHSLRVPSNPWACGTPEPFSYTGNHQLYPNSFVLHHPHPYPSPPYSLSPPPSPCYSTTSPTYLTIPCHFPFPPSVSPLSSDSCSSTSPPSFSFATSTPILNLASVPKPPPSARPPTPHRSMDPAPVPALTTSSCPPQRTLRRALFQNQQQNMWRPW